MDFILQTINILGDLLVALIFIRVIFSWMQIRSGWIARVIQESTDPILRPIQKALPRTGMLDFSPIVAFFVIELVRSLLNQMLI